MKTLSLVLLLIIVYLSISLINEREAHRQADEVIAAHETYEAMQEVYVDTLEAKYQRDVTLTAYTEHQRETAINCKPRPGIVAVSRDLFDAGWTFGKRVYISGVGVYEIGDLMNERWTDRIDIYIDNHTEAKAFGVKQVRASLIVG